jgi:hypothetical protein
MGATANKLTPRSRRVADDIKRHLISSVLLEKQDASVVRHQLYYAYLHGIQEGLLYIENQRLNNLITFCNTGKFPC